MLLLNFLKRLTMITSYNVLITGDTNSKISAMLAKYIFLRKPNNDNDFTQADNELIISVTDHDFDIAKAIDYAATKGTIDNVTIAGLGLHAQCLDTYKVLMSHKMGTVFQDYNGDTFKGLAKYWQDKFPDEHMPPLFGFFITDIYNPVYVPTGIPLDTMAARVIGKMYHLNRNVNYAEFLSKAIITLEGDIRYISPEHTNFTLGVMYGLWNSAAFGSWNSGI